MKLVYYYYRSDNMLNSARILLWYLQMCKEHKEYTTFSFFLEGFCDLVCDMSFRLHPKE